MRLFKKKKKKACSGKFTTVTSLSVIFPFLIAVRVWLWFGHDKGFSFCEEVSQTLLQIVTFKDDTDVFIELEKIRHSYGKTKTHNSENEECAKGNYNAQIKISKETVSYLTPVPVDNQ